MPSQRMKVGLVALLLCGSFFVAAQTPRWQVSLQTPGLNSFDRQASAAWMSQQGVLFLTPDRILLYQVNRTREFAKLGPRRAGGGAGNFLLNIRLLSTQDGTLLRSMDVPTSGGGDSHVLATKDGGFIVQAGSALISYSADFAKTAERPLDLDTTVRMEHWQARISSSGEKLVLMHERVFMMPEFLADQTVIHDGRARVDVQVLNARTLQTERSFALEHTLAFWAPQDDHVISSNPAHSYSDGQMGVLDFNGHWSPVKAEVPRENNACHLGMIVIDPQRVGLYGCDAVTVFSSAGERLFTHHDLRLMFVSAVASGAYLAAQCDHFRMESSGPNGGLLAGTRPDRIEVYELSGGARRLTVPIHSGRAYFAISAQGDLVVVDGPSLRVFSVEK